MRKRARIAPMRPPLRRRRTHRKKPFAARNQRRHRGRGARLLRINLPRATSASDAPQVTKCAGVLRTSRGNLLPRRSLSQVRPAPPVTTPVQTSSAPSVVNSAPLSSSSSVVNNAPARSQPPASSQQSSTYAANTNTTPPPSRPQSPIYNANAPGQRSAIIGSINQVHSSGIFDSNGFDIGWGRLGASGGFA